MKIENPKVFISYWWSNEKYIDRVVEFAQRLRTDGVYVLFDQFHMKLGNDTNDFMEKCVKDPSVTNVFYFPLTIKRNKNKTHSIEETSKQYLSAFEDILNK